eukprot:scaffold18877_cov80-Skeletonema_marinoi.AAC.1
MQSFLQKEAWRTLSNTSMEMIEESLADVRRDNTIKTRCVRFGVDYIERRHGETSAEQQQRHNTLQKAIERERKRRARAQQSTEEREDGRRQDREARRRERSVDETRDSVFKNETHQVKVCVVCDRVIIGEEKVCNISTERLEENRHRISVDVYEEFYRKTLHPLLVEQYSVEGLDRLLLSPRAYREGDNFDNQNEMVPN